ncbi:hypothetical protein AX17_003593 [Amanita inopinata Kibby_2008]|nr:hypothetical protein AX17_003593 [Amanita inopinata Kibby_2008]
MRSMSISKKAALPIDVIIVGGGAPYPYYLNRHATIQSLGIGGLACAYALGQSGHRVRVLESNPGLHRLSGGVRIPPNLSKILKEWGLGPELSRMQKCRKSSFHSLKDGELLGILEWQEDVLQETGGDFFLMHHADLHQLLYDLACSVGAIVSFDAGVASVSVDLENDEEIPVVTLEDGTRLTADLVIGADGSNSIVREAVNGPLEYETDSGQSFYTITIPSEMLQADPDLAKWANLPQWPIWMEDSRSVLGYPIRNGSEYCVHLYWPDHDLHYQSEAEEGWHVVVPTDIIDFDGYDPTVRKLFTMVPTALRTRYIRKQRVEDWVDETGRIILVGEAAHPLLPCTMHGPSLAVEDAAVLGVLMARLRTLNQIPQLTEAYQDLRQDRCSQVIDSELNNAALVTLGPGEHRLARDAALRLSLQARGDHWDESQLRDQWDEIGAVFGYSAREAAEDWWVKWGNLIEFGMMETVHESLGLRFEVTKVEVQYD